MDLYAGDTTKPATASNSNLFTPREGVGSYSLCCLPAIDQWRMHLQWHTYSVLCSRDLAGT